MENLNFYTEIEMSEPETMSEKSEKILFNLFTCILM